MGAQETWSYQQDMVAALARIAAALEKIERHLDTLDKDSDYPLRVRKVGA